MKNLKTATKLLVSFLIVSILAVVISCVGVFQVMSMTNETIDNQQHITLPLDYMVHFAIPYGQVRSSMRDIGRSITAEDNEKHAAALKSNLDLVNQYMTQYFESVKANPQAGEEEYNAVKLICDTLVTYTDICVNKLIPAGMNNDSETVYAIISDDLGPPGTIIRENVDFLTAYNSDRGGQSAIKASGDLRTSVIVNIALLAAVLCAVVILARYLSAIISKPIIALTDFMERAGNTGDIRLSEADSRTIQEYARVKDEIGRCISATAKFVGHVTEVSGILEAVAHGDLTGELHPLSDADVMENSLGLMTTNLNSMFVDIKTATNQVSAGSAQIADGAQHLAQGSTEQAATVQELSASISDITSKTRENAEMAGNAAKLAETIMSNAEKGSRQMDEMVSAVGDINQANQDINRVIKVIDDIAFQTNILALNAAVEAARAGQHGKGFAVVAEEVRNLAAKSAEAAKETGALISNSTAKAELGARIASETAASLTEIVSGIHESDAIIGKIAEASEEQSASITQISDGIEQVAKVVQQNSATAEESAAASEELSGQASMLGELISQFKLKSDAMPAPLQNEHIGPPVSGKDGFALTSYKA